ncbi:hypothetical protein ACQ86G_18710 [Roseateles chitinivorans]|uniref:hypothetical protein n=1 Tax=Roseateles chitinivorans TaxID=2917965 RepID=UPI003D67A74E
MRDILIPEDRLAVGDALLLCLAESVPSVRWRELDDDLRQAYARHVALLNVELRGELNVADLPEPIAFCNAYYWILVFAKRYQARYGFDAGIEQEVFSVLERAPANVDWQAVERVNEAVRQLARSDESPNRS